MDSLKDVGHHCTSGLNRKTNPRSSGNSGDVSISGRVITVNNRIKLLRCSEHGILITRGLAEILLQPHGLIQLVDILLVYLVGATGDDNERPLKQVTVSNQRHALPMSECLSRRQIHRV